MTAHASIPAKCPDSPLVTVILPTHNRAPLLRRALHSVLHQTYANLEVVVVDDASADNTADLVGSMPDPRIRYLRHEARMGAAAARNTGIRAATGDFIAFQDSDDEWLCEKLEKQMAVLLRARSSVGLVYSGFLRFERDRATYYPRKRIKTPSGNMLRELAARNFITTQAAVVRKECFLKAGLFDEQLPRLQDWELFIRLAQHYEFIGLEEPLLIAFHTPESITADASLFPVAYRMILEKHKNMFQHHPWSLARHYFALARLSFKAGRIAEGRRYCLALARIKWWGRRPGP